MYQTVIIVESAMRPLIHQRVLGVNLDGWDLPVIYHVFMVSRYLWTVVSVCVTQVGWEPVVTLSVQDMDKLLMISVSVILKLVGRVTSVIFLVALDCTTLIAQAMVLVKVLNIFAHVRQGGEELDVKYQTVLGNQIAMT